MLKNIWMKAVPWTICAVITAACASAGTVTAYADEKQKAEGYIVFGEDLSKDQQKKVLKYFDVDSTDGYSVSYTTNAEEHKAFDAYLDSKVIGSRAVSSILLVPRKEGKGISVEMDNITYCTEEMYQNALISAGVEDVSVHVAAPFEVSGTCALLSAMNAYELMTGEELDEEAVDTAVDELVTTGTIGDAIGDNDEAAELIATLKQEIAKRGEELTDDQMDKIIDNTAEEMNITLDDETKDLIKQLLKKLSKIDLDVNSLKEQAESLYNKVDELIQKNNITLPEVDKEQAMNFFQKLIQAIRKLLGM